MGDLGEMRIVGIGVDMVSVEDLRSRIQKNPALVQHIFTASEREWCEAYHDPAERYAGRFAAKEAFYKALPTHIQNQTDWLDVEVIPSTNGKPEICLSKRFKEQLKTGYIGPIFSSISHECGFALAFVVLGNSA